MKIEYLEIRTSQLENQLHFYGDLLGLEIANTTTASFEVQVGFSVLKFKKDQGATPYHIAFHIEAHQEQKALVWLKERVSILKNEEEEIIDFNSWNAKSLYFYDADMNVLEFISRRHLYPASSEEFDGKNIKGISEIGLATDNVLQCYTYLNHQFGLIKFTGNYNTFCAAGDDEGLFIITNYNEKTWFPVGDKAFPSPFLIRFSTSEVTANLEYEAGVLGRRVSKNDY